MANLKYGSIYLILFVYLIHFYPSKNESPGQFCTFVSVLQKEWIPPFYKQLSRYKGQCKHILSRTHTHPCHTCPLNKELRTVTAVNPPVSLLLIFTFERQKGIQCPEVFLKNKKGRKSSDGQILEGYWAIEQQSWVFKRRLLEGCIFFPVLEKAVPNVGEQMRQTQISRPILYSLKYESHRLAYQ